MIDGEDEPESEPEPLSWLEQIAEVVSTAGPDELEVLEAIEIPGVTIGISDVDVNARLAHYPRHEDAWGG